MDAGVAPDWVLQTLPILLWTTMIAGAVWLLFVVLDYFNRRDYNLTMSDRGGKGGAQPGFLKVDHDKREAAQRAGKAFDEKIAHRAAVEAPASTSRKILSLAQMATVFFAVVTAATVAVGAIGRIEYYDAAVRRLSNWERLTEIVSTYWPGFIVVALMIAAQIYQAIRQARAG